MSNAQITDNTRLEEVMALFKQDPSSEHRALFLQTVAASVLMQPCQIDRETEPGKAKPRPLVLKDSSGNSFFSFFTSEKHIPEGQKFPAMLAIGISVAAEMAMHLTEPLQGFVINPFTDNIVIREAALRRLAEAARAGRPPVDLSFPEKMMRVVLPKMFFDNSAAFLENYSGRNGENLTRLFEEYARHAGKDEIFRPEHFEVMALNLREDLQHLQIGLGEDFLNPGRYTDLFCFYDPVKKKANLFLMESGRRGRVCYQIGEDNRAEALPVVPSEGSELYTLMELISD